MILAVMWVATPPLLAGEPEPPVTAETADLAVQAVEQGDYTPRGADTCLKCHDEDNEYPVFPIFKTKHAVGADERTPFAGLQCEACHGPGAAHAKRPAGGESRAPILKFVKDSWTPVKDQNRKCLECHEARVPENPSDPNWHPTMVGMSWNAGLSDSEQSAMIAYLAAAAQ